MDALPGFVRRHPGAMSLALGALAALGFPPLGLWPFSLTAMGVFALLVFDSPTIRAAFLRGWLFGVAHFTVTNNWIATAFTYQAEMPAILGWAAVPLLSLYLAVYPGLAAGFAKALARGGGLAVFALALGAGWVLGEWLRSWVFTGYAWGPFSLSLMGSWDRPGLGALLPFTGTYALSGLAVAASALLAAAALHHRWPVLGISVALLAAGMHWPAGQGREGVLPVTLVQPNLRQEEIDDPSKFESQFQTIAALSVPREPQSRRLVLWPESGVPDYLRDGYPQRYYDRMTAAGNPAFARARIGSVIGEGSFLLTGAQDLEIGTVDGRERATGAYNVVTALDAEGQIEGSYAKAHLVPYGEYLPMRALLEPLGASRLVAGTIDFIPGPGPRSLDLGDYGRAGIQICYEIVFSGEVVDRSDRPEYIFNPSNDGWFGAWGPPQHLGQARMRAAEEGLPVLRATTTGISAIVDARGVVRDHIGRNVADRIDTLVPPAHAPTWFARLGHWLTLGWGLVLLAASLVVMQRLRRYSGGNT
ncbi:apolipoprotein N-acyltransferase [Qipengyuania sp. XHP0207]|uniref:apolipoprotein N-acyltransferase n=1 Tax=Qipengyuania sp. XHP0207 TaxID=3038078 RepID=UPI00241E7DC3|nr:apolipoprotein N-acyltransferase [Qipengyuania sp. XHP0207]MDG5748305.1 apolipoprotein N-acyltransferase [Qipengyuania sp. XHP0207]